MMTNYEKELQKEKERMKKRIKAQNRRVNGLLITNIVWSMISILIITILLTR